MSYIKCKSFISNKEVQYGLIDVKLKHNILQQDYGTVNASSTTYWNTSPELLGTLKRTLNNNNNLYETSNAMKIAGITGLSKQGYSASGTLDSVYTYVRSGKQPIISNKVFDIENMNEGYNQFDLFETENVKVILECLKVKASKLYISSLANYSFRELDGSLTEDPYVIADCVIKQILKSSNKVIGEYSYIYNIVDNVFPIKFSLNTEIFRIINFDPSYYTQYYYSSRYNLWLDDGCTQNNKLYNNGDFVTNKGDFVGIAVSVYMGDYWYTTRNDYNMNRRQVSSSDNVIISDNLIRSFNNTAQNSFYNHNINNNPNEFIIFGVPSIGNSYITTPQEAIDLANSTINSESKYHTKGYNFTDTNIVNPWNFILSPVMAPIVTTTYEEISKGTSGVFIPLTNTVFEGDPVNPDEPVGPDEPETTEPADDPNTDYTPEVSDGEEDFQYPPGAVVGGLPAALNAYRPSYSNYLFSRYYKSNTDDNDNASSFIQDAANPSAFELWGATFKLLTGHPTPGEIISRVYMLPFEYNEIKGTDSAGFAYSAPVYGPIGPVTLGAKNYSQNPNLTGEPETDNVHYYLQILNRFITLDLGTVTIERVFNNYLDYTETKYTLNLPYTAGKIELDPDYLFMNGRIKGTVKLIGYIDIDTGELTITVQLNGQLYYQTTVNIAIDRLASVNDNLATPLAISKAVMASAATAGGISKLMSKKQPDRSKEYEEMRTAEIIKRQQNETTEIAKRTSIQEEASMRILKARKEGGL